MTNSTEWLYGRQAVREMLRARRRRVQRILLAKGSQRTGIVAEIMALAQGVRCPVGEGERPALDQVTAGANHQGVAAACLLYTSDAAAERSSVDLGGRRIIKKKNK